MKFDKDRYDLLVGRIIRYSTIIEQMIAESSYQLGLINSTQEFMSNSRHDEKCNDILKLEVESICSKHKERLDEFIKLYKQLLYKRHDFAHAIISKPIDEESIFIINIRSERGKVLKEIKIMDISDLENILTQYNQLRISFRAFTENLCLEFKRPIGSKE